MTVAAGLGGDEKHGKRFQPALLLQLPQDAQAIHHRHHHIQQYGAHMVPQGMQLFQTLLAIFCLCDGIVVGKDVFQNGPVEVTVIHDQDGIRRFGRSLAAVAFFLGHSCAPFKNRRQIRRIHCDTMVLL